MIRFSDQRDPHKRARILAFGSPPDRKDLDRKEREMLEVKAGMVLVVVVMVM